MRINEEGEDMRERYIAPAIMLVAGAITSILNIVKGIDFLKGLERLLIVLIVFYIMGRIAAIVIKKATKTIKKPSQEEEEPSQEEEELSLEADRNTQEELITEDMK
jgi:large-conductance mechanosensitive channel